MKGGTSIDGTGTPVATGLEDSILSECKMRLHYVGMTSNSELAQNTVNVSLNNRQHFPC